MKKIFPVIATLAALLPAAAWADDDTNCGQLEIVNRIQMINAGSRDLIPVTINGVKRNFLFDTGGYFTQVSSPLAQELGLKIEGGANAVVDVTGRRSASVATINDFIAGQMHGTSLIFQISTDSDDDGIFALDRWQGVDLDVDFGTDTLNMFSQKHCPGAVQYWTAPVIAVVPITMDGNHVTVPVTLDGHQEMAMIDTGAGDTTLNQDEEDSLFHLTLGDADTPEGGRLNNDASLKTYRHIFKNLSFGDVAVNQPVVRIIPPIPDKKGPYGWIHVSQPQKIVIGMDVLRKLHVYFAFGEKKMYVSVASAPTPEHLAQQRPQWLAAIRLTHKTEALAIIKSQGDILEKDSKNIDALARRCFWASTIKFNLDAALADCEQGLALRPGSIDLIDSSAFVLYQQGKYQEALNAYNAALAAFPNNAPLLFMRGNTKGKLGDQAGKDADIAAAHAIQRNVESIFQPFDIDL